MNFLFFDIECANCFGGVGKIFSFGYVLTDEHFNVLERDDILMNPDVTRWDWYVIKNMVAYDRSIFPEKPKFNEFYPTIAALFQRADVVAGYAVENDVKFLLDECKRYSLPPFPVLYYDIQRIVRIKYGLPNLISLKKALELLALPEDSILHKSDDDAVYTMRVAEALTREEGCTLPELIRKYPACDVFSEDGRVKVHGEHGYTVIGAKGDERDPERLHRSSPRYVKFREVIRNTRPNPREEQILKGMRIIANLDYEEHHRTVMMRLAKRIAELGGTYTLKASNANVFLEGKCKNPHCVRYRRAMRSAEEGKEIFFVPMEDFLERIGVSDEVEAPAVHGKLVPEQTPLGE
ncbi:MAG: hypothetical protein IJY12_02970 [Clostridia bacterium]|nr:hypothetical protein [Clostridia bacterium]